MLRKMTTVLPYCAGTVLLFVAFLFLRVLRLLPYGKSIWAKLWKMTTTIDLPMENYWGSLFTWHMFQSVRTTFLYELQKSARLGQRAPNPSVVTLDGASQPHLLNFCRGNRPLVLNFCSWSCPVFRARTQEFLSIVRQFRDAVDFLTVYIEEAHPSNGWAFEVSRKKSLLRFKPSSPSHSEILSYVIRTHLSSRLMIPSTVTTRIKANEEHFEIFSGVVIVFQLLPILENLTNLYAGTLRMRMRHNPNIKCPAPD